MAVRTITLASPREGRFNAVRAGAFALGVALAAALFMLYVNGWALLAKSGLQRARLAREIKQERIENARLREAVRRARMPQQVMAWAEAAGMVRAERAITLDPTPEDHRQVVASAR